MDHRVTVTICGNEYTFLAEEDSAYVEKVAAYVDQRMTDILESTKAGRTDAAVLTAANIADELFKAQEIAENLRSQLKEYLDEASKSKNEISELKREIFKLQNQR
ncbi:MAG TPA: cell division protein ZapA [Firmicutes bacterium]|nr:cell division protein ZapA [Bacillota bacterium]